MRTKFATNVRTSVYRFRVHENSGKAELTTCTHFLGLTCKKTPNSRTPQSGPVVPDFPERTPKDLVEHFRSPKTRSLTRSISLAIAEVDIACAAVAVDNICKTGNRYPGHKLLQFLRVRCGQRMWLTYRIEIAVFKASSEK